MAAELNIEDLHADLKKHIGRPAAMMTDKFAKINDMLKHVNPYLLTTGKIPLPRLRTERALKHNNGANKDVFVTEGGKAKLDARWLEAQEGKVEFAFLESEIMALWNSYLFKLTGKSEQEIRDYMTNFPFEDVIYNAIAERTYKDMRDDSWQGVIGVSSESPIDGWLKKINDAVVDGEIPADHVAETAPITESNVVTEMKKVFARVAAKSYALTMPLQIHVAPNLVWLYNNNKLVAKEDYQPIIQNGMQVPNELKNAVFVEEPGLEGTNAIIVTAKDNLAIGMNTLPGSVNFRTQLHDYTIKVFGKVVLDVNIQDGRFLFCNDDLLTID